MAEWPKEALCVDWLNKEMERSPGILQKFPAAMMMSGVLDHHIRMNQFKVCITEDNFSALRV